VELVQRIIPENFEHFDLWKEKMLLVLFLFWSRVTQSRAINHLYKYVKKTKEQLFLIPKISIRIIGLVFKKMRSKNKSINHLYKYVELYRR